MSEHSERRLGFDEFRATMTEILENDRAATKQANALKERQADLEKIVIATDARSEGFLKSLDRLSDNIEQVTTRAVEAQVGSKDAARRVEKMETVQQTMSTLVAQHDTRIAAVESEQKTGFIKWGIVAGFLALIFAMFWIDPEAATQAIDAVKDASE